MKNKKINESITSSAVSPFSYIILIDATRSIAKVRSYIRMIFPTENSDIVKSWFKKLVASEVYGENKDKLESLSSRFFGNPQLTSLFSTLQKIKDMFVIIKHVKNKSGIKVPVILINGHSEILEFDTLEEAESIRSLFKQNSDSGYKYEFKKI